MFFIYFFIICRQKRITEYDCTNSAGQQGSVKCTKSGVNETCYHVSVSYQHETSMKQTNTSRMHDINIKPN